MLLNEIKHTSEFATGVDSKTKKPVIIQKSISYIYHRYERYETKPEIHYDAVTWKNQIAYGQLEAMILGLPLTEMDQLDLDKYVIRFGWISKDMYQLEWVPIRKLLLKYLDNQLTSTEKNKFQQICRTLAIPMRTMTARRKEHLDKMKRIAEAEAVEPIKVMETAEQV